MAADSTRDIAIQADKPIPINLAPGALASLRVYEREIATYRRELPRLLQEGQEGRHALIKGDEILNIWETWGDAIQAGRERFGLEPIFVARIDHRDIERYALLDEWLTDRRHRWLTA